MEPKPDPNRTDGDGLRICVYTHMHDQVTGGTDMPNYLVTLTMVIEARDKTEASVKALNDSTNWQFNASVEEITDEDEEYTITDDD